MRVNRLKIEKFRNLKTFSLEPCDSANIISGNNAQGKTNLLEALWLFTGSKSFRGSREKDFIPNDGDTASLELEFFAQGRCQTASLRWSGEKKQIFLNGVKQDRMSVFSGVFCGVVFSPDHMSLIKNGPEYRRQMIDVSLSQAYPKYAQAMSNYQKALKQRNTLLKDISFNASLIDLLDIWDIHIVNYGGYITALRDRYIRKLAVYAKQFYQGISGGKEDFTLTYEPSFGHLPTDGFELKDFQSVLAAALKANRSDDLRLGSTSVGPHRDDLEIQVNGLSARTFGSQGQQRSSILAIKLAECNILEEQTGEPPVVMLDDVMSELDEERRSYLLNKLEYKQVFITCCNTKTFEELDRGSIFLMEQGQLSKTTDKLICSPAGENEVNPCICI